MSDFPDFAQSKTLDQHEHNPDASSKRVILRIQNLDTGEWENYNPNQALTERYDYNDPVIIYIGQAYPGVDEDALGWVIIKYDLTDSNDASGKVASDVSWDNRALGAYQ